MKIYYINITPSYNLLYLNQPHHPILPLQKAWHRFGPSNKSISLEERHKNHRTDDTWCGKTQEPCDQASPLTGVIPLPNGINGL